jgi:hypothetical protein
MGFLAFFFRSPIGWLVGFLSSVILLAVLLVLVTGVLAYTGGPGACTPGDGPIEISDAQAASFDQKWDQLDASLDSGTPAATTLTESEISSRAEKYAGDHSGDVSDLRVCIHDGKGEVTGKVDASLGSIKFKASGNVDLTGGHPKAEFDDISVGNVPGVVLGLLEGIVEDAIQELLDDIRLSHTYMPVLSPGSAEIQGTP